MRCRSLSLMLVVAVLINCSYAQTAAPAGIPWAGTVRDGLKQALINQKQILLYFYAPDLAACTKCEEQVLSNAEVQQAIAANYIPVKVNVREVPATARFYQANDDTQLPRVLILSADDKVVSRFTAGANPTEFVAQLKAGVNNTPANPKLEQIGSIAKTASSFFAPTAEPTAMANAAMTANAAQPNPNSGVTPTAWAPGTTGANANALLLPNFAPGNNPAGAAVPGATGSTSTTGPAVNTTAASPASSKASLLPVAVGPLARTTNEASASAPNPAAVAATTPATPSLASYGMQAGAAPSTPAAAPTGYGMQNVVPNLAAAAQPYQQHAQQTVTQWQNNANQTLTNAQTQVNQSVASAQQNLQNQIGAATNQLNAAAPAVGSFYDAGVSPRPSMTQGAGLANVPGLGGGATTSGATPAPQLQLAASPYSLNGMATATIPTYPAPAPATPAYTSSVPAAAPATPAAATAPASYAMAPGASYGIPNTAPPTPALPGHPKEKAGLGNYSNDSLQGYLGNGGKPVLPAAQVNATAAAKPAAPAAPPVGSVASAPAVPATPEISLQGNCPVTITEARKWAKGDPKYGAVHRGKTYLFASAAEQQKFLAAPDKYSPVLGGNDPVVMFHEGRYIAGSPVNGAMYKNRMYLFSTPAAKTEFETNPTKYEQAVSVAETQAGIIVR